MNGEFNLNYINKSVEIIKQNQASSGAYIASPNFSQYKYCWFRDGAFIADSMNSVNERKSASSFFEWGFKIILKNKNQIERILSKKKENINLNDLLTTRYTADGNNDTGEWTNEQTDGYGTFLWAFEKYSKGEINEEERKAIIYISEYLQKVCDLPCYDVWEESPEDIHTSTLLSIVAGLKSAEKLLNSKSNWENILDYIIRNLTKDKRLIKSSSNSGVDGSLVWGISPFDILDTEEEIIEKTCEKIYSDLCFKGGTKRFLEDNYFGGGSWILLSCYLGKYFKTIGNEKRYFEIKKWVESQFQFNGYLPEQTPEFLLKPDFYKKWVDKWGKIAEPLLWSHAAYIYLMK